MRVLAFQGMSRQFRNNLPDYKPGSSVKIDRNKFQGHLQNTLEVILSDHDSRRKPTIYTGGAGIAYALWHILQVPESVSLLPNEQDLRQKAVRYAATALDQHHQRPSGVPWSLLFGESGAHFVNALVASTAASALLPSAHGSADLHALAERHVESYVKYKTIAMSDACHEDEFLYGRAGYLMGCLLLNDYYTASPGSAASIPTSVIEGVARAILQSGRRQAAALPRNRAECNTPLWWEWHGSPYLGAAHGSMGILYILLNVPMGVLVESIPEAKDWIRGAVDYVLTLECDETGSPGHGGEFPSRMGPSREKEPLLHWCHGAPGAAFLFSQAEKVLGGNGKYMKVALRSGEAVWRRGLLKKGPGICHGVSGSAYTLLRLYKETKDQKWLHRAVQFADFMHSEEFLNEARTPDHPNSLFEGLAGAVCLYADLQQPEQARFPLFELRRPAD